MPTLRHGERPGQGRGPAPAAAGAQRQRIKTATPGTDVGCDGPKHVTGRQRHIGVDPLGLLGTVGGTAATTDARQGLGALWTRDVASGVPRLRTIGVAGGDDAQGRRDWGRGLPQRHTIDLEAVAHTGTGCPVGKQRWQVERTRARWLTARRPSRDYEVLTASSEAMLQISMIRILLKRLA